MNTKLKSMKFNAALVGLEVSTGRTPTKYQLALYRFIAEGTGNARLIAVAGSGKTTSILDSCAFIDRADRVLVVAFNKVIADHVNTLLAAAGYKNASGRTLHSVGCGALRSLPGLKFLKVDTRKTDWIVGRVMGGWDQMNDDRRKVYFDIMRPVKKVISLLKNYGFGAIRPEATQAEIEALMERFDIEPPDDGNMPEFWTVLAAAWKESKLPNRTIDFDDMLYLPILLNAAFPKFTRIFVDESQDLNPIQLAIVKRLMGPDSRVVFVGDPNQAIYGFRGADPEAMDTLADMFGTIDLPLSISWRCPKAVIAEAKKIVPQIEASPNAKEGSVDTITEDTFWADIQSGDYVLCRVTAPLASMCLKLIREGRKAIVRGRDIGQNLTSMLKKIAEGKSPRTADEVTQLITDYGNAELDKLNKRGREGAYLAMSDKIATLQVLSDGCDTFHALNNRIETIFKDEDAGVVFSTIHKAKGLEADTVYVIRPELLPHPLAKQEWQREQEHNLRYVAITRAMNRLRWVKTNKNKSKEE